VQTQIRAREIDYPVALDSDYEIWRAFDNHYWPALYFVDRGGVIRDQHFGEGRYEQSEQTIQRLLGIERAPISVDPTGVEAPADWDNLRSPETYLGYARAERLAAPERLRLNEWGLVGEWTTEAEKVILERRNGSIRFRFQARDAHLVLSRRSDEPIPFRILLDGEPPGASHGLDVDEHGNGALDEGRLYQLVRQPEVDRERTLEITFLEPAAEAYVFTFG
jgi:hypothetical protein